MSDEKRTLLQAYRAHVDLDETPEHVLDAWNTATEAEKRDLLDRTLMEALLTDTFRRREAEPAQPLPRRRAVPRLRAMAAAAALVVAIGAGLYLWQSKVRYPQPRATGDFALRLPTGERTSRHGTLRGQCIAAGPSGASLSLGGYCEVALGPAAVVILRGEPRKEVICLEEGTLVARITPSKGQFVVLTPRGSLEVVGTEFVTTVEYDARKGESTMKPRRMSAIVTVTVVSGLVAYHFGDVTGVLSGGMNKAFAAEPAGSSKKAAKKIEAGKPTYRAKTHKAWKERGRIVGRVRRCPGCTVKALDAKSKKAVKSFAVKPGGRVYELQWLKPGKYILLVTADGYEALDVHNLVVKAKNDLHVDIGF